MQINIPNFSNVFVVSQQPLVEPILKSMMYYNNLQINANTQIVVSLYQKYILLQKENCYYQINFDFDLKFTLMREKVPPAFEKVKVGEPYGLRFQKTNIQKIIELTSSNKQELILWRNHLAKKINQRDFHQLYKPFRKIGKGNSATVYLAERKEDNKKIAIKAFAKQALTLESKGKQSLLNEINIMRSLDHRCLMKLYQVFQTNNSYYLAIQHLEGGQLFQKINNRRFTLVEIQEILKNLVQGLEYLHKCRIIHRDLKPQNLIFRTVGKNDIVIADFGLATRADEHQYIFLRCGTPGYVAPQIINFRGTNGQEPISDIFSLGIIAHILATARSPFPGRQYQIVLQQNRVCNFNFNLEIYKMVEPSLLDLVIRMMEVKPEKRIKTQQILIHPFFQKDFNININRIHNGPIHEMDEECVFIELVKDSDNKTKQRKKIQDSIGSFVVGKPNMLKGNDQQYNSVNSVGSSNVSVPASPQSIKKQSKFNKKRDRQQPEGISQYKKDIPKKKAHLNERVKLDQLQQKEEQKQEVKRQI